MTFILVTFAVVVAIGLGSSIFNSTRLGDKASDKELARTLLGVVSFFVGIVLIEPLPAISACSLLFCLLMTNWLYRKQ
jgi:hypothetical protein